MEREEKMQFAVLIDAENVSARYVQVIFDELEKYGFASCRRIYGNWSKESGWKENILLEYSVTPIQQFSYTSGKNSTDMAMVIDAMDLLYQNKVDGFCLVPVTATLLDWPCGSGRRRSMCLVWENPRRHLH